MLCTEKPEAVAPTSLRWSAYLLPMGYLSYASGMTTLPFAIDSLAVNGHLLYHAYNFYKDPSIGNSRKLFLATLIYLPIFFLLMGIHKANWNSDQKKEDKKEEGEENQIEEVKQ